MEKINGLCIEGKFYEVVETNELTCKGCELQGRCLGSKTMPCADHFMPKGRTAIFRYSQELTDKINKK